MFFISVLSCVLVLSLLRKSGAVDSELGHVLLLKDVGKVIHPFCLTGLAPSSNQMAQTSSTSWSPLLTLDATENYSSYGWRKWIILTSPSNNLNSDADFSSQVFVLVPDDSRNPELFTTLTRDHPQSVFGRLSSTDFKQLSMLLLSPNGSNAVARIETDDTSSSASGRPIYVVLFVYLCAFASILLGSVIVFLTKDELLQQLKERENQSRWSKLSSFLVIGLLVIFASACLLIYYFLYDIAVYLAIGLYSVVGVFAITHMLSFWIMYFCVPARKRFPIHFSACGRDVNFTLSVTQLCVFPLAVSIMATWLVFRNDPNVGWPLQSIIGVILVARILSVALPLPSLKLIFVVFSLFLLYDVFFVFITPMLMKPTSSPPIPPAAQISREARSVPDGKSVMEAIATGSAGHSGEALPVSFRFQVTFTAGVYHCSTLVYRALLGYGDAVFPGFLSAYMAFFDSIWQIRFRRNFLASLIGYLLGIAVTQFVLNLMGKSQPALLYLCPCTLGITVIVSGMFGGLDELRRMWNGAIPAVLPENCIIFQSAKDESLKVEAASTENASHGDNLDHPYSQISLLPYA